MSAPGYRNRSLTADPADQVIANEGGESSPQAMNRIVEVVEEAFSRNNNNTVIVTHGNLMSLLLMFFNKDFRFDDWKNLSIPDVFLLINECNKVTFQRVWKKRY
ncbi:histidine phosphatase family protein [Cytobacillus depressus]|uniref:Histidine phosphatase family protein n=1 Tax=Cytobacillus depressus TaxID=1602942 RepID=A0A6L3V3C3_9BACI|nr:histidine phosphatase family protein [Cytobacillus depressus]KAB2334450.1 histidine phosphatase family protein [Cytobacillus depressus]